MRQVSIDYSNTQNLINNLRSILRNLDNEKREVNSALRELYDLENYYYNKGEIVQELEYRQRKISKDIESTEELINNINRFLNEVKEKDGNLANKFKQDIKAYAKKNNIDLVSDFENFLNKFQSGLDILGFIPVIGDIADGINVFISLARGDIKGAFINALSIFPFGDAAKAFKYMGKTSDVLKFGSKSVDMRKATLKIAKKKAEKTLKKQTLDLASKGEKVFKKELNGTLSLGNGDYVAWIKDRGKTFLSNTNDKLPPWMARCLEEGKCLVGDTLIKTDKGLKEIRELVIGDMVLSKNEDLGINEYKKITAIHRNSTYESCIIKTKNSIIESTVGHLFMVKDKWWKAAINIKEKDYLELANGSYEEVIEVRNEIKEYPIKIYNITVEGTHNYYAGKTEILTHNMSKEDCKRLDNLVNGNTKGAADHKKINYKKVFFDEYPDLEGKVVVHHGVEQQVLKKPQTQGLFTQEEMHSLDNLRGIPKEINSDLHLSKIRKEWNRFYREFPNPTKEQLLNKRLEIDNKYGDLFNPPIK